VIKRPFFLAIEAIALSLLGYACFLGPLGKTPIPGGAGSAEQVVERAKEDLAGRKGIDKDEITVTAVEAVNWPDTSLGCPVPDMMYTQVITPGYRILLSYAEETYVYHSDRGNHLVYCQSSSP